MKIIVSRITGIEEVNFDLRKVNPDDSKTIMDTIERLSKSGCYHGMQYKYGKQNAIYVDRNGVLIVTIKESNSVRELLATIIAENLVATGRGLTQEEFDKMYLELKIA